MVFIQSLYHNERLLCDLACHLYSLGTIRRIRCYLMHMIFIMGVNNISMSREDTEIHSTLSDVT